MSETEPPRRWWHYTVGIYVLPIVAAGKIARAKTGVPRGERPAVWFSSRPTWEPTATKGAIVDGQRREMTISEMVEHAGGLVRLEVDVAVVRHTWADHQRIGQVDPRMATYLEAAAREHGADPRDWRVSYRDVPLGKVLSVEASDDGQAWEEVGRPAVEGLSLCSDFVERVKAAATQR